MDALVQSNLPHAMAFHHENEEDKRKLALAYAGEHGRIATLPDIINARLHSPPKSPAWKLDISTDTVCWIGTSRQGTPCLVVTHGNGPKVAKDTPAEVFQALLAGEFGPVQILDLTHYSSSNIYMTPEQVLENEILKLLIGDQVAAFLALHTKLTKAILKKTPRTDKSLHPMEKDVPMDACIICRLNYWIRDSIEKSRKNKSYVCALPVCICSYLDSDNSDQARGFTKISFCGEKTGHVVGVRDANTPTHIVDSFRNVVGGVRRKWKHFVQPLVEVPNDPFPGIKPDGSRERPYYVMTSFDCGSLVGRVDERGAGTDLPEFRIVKKQLISSVQEMPFGELGTSSMNQYPYTNLWQTALGRLPKKANAMSFGGATFGGGKAPRSYVAYYHIEVEPFYLLMQCGKTLFSQYPDGERKTLRTGIPHRPVIASEHLGDKNLYFSNEQYSEMSYRKWALYGAIMRRAPDGANAIMIHEPNVIYLDGTPNATHISFYRVTLDDAAFRPLWEINADFAWQIERRKAAGLL